MPYSLAVRAVARTHMLARSIDDALQQHLMPGRLAADESGDDTSDLLLPRSAVIAGRCATGDDAPSPFGSSWVRGAANEKREPKWL